MLNRFSGNLPVRRGLLLAALTFASVGCSVYGEELLIPDEAGVAGTGGTGVGGVRNDGGAPGTGGAIGAGSGGQSVGGGGRASSGGGDSGGAPASGGLAGSGAGGNAMGDGGSGGGTNSGGGAAGGGSPTVDELIDDMEDDDPTVLALAGRNGRWNVYNDGSEGGTQTPVTDFTGMHLLEETPPQGGSYSAHTKGGGFAAWGAVLNVTMRSWPDYEETPPYDAGGYVGMSFHAKVGAGSTTKVRVRLVTDDTDPRGGNCETSGATADLCFDHYALPVTIGTTFERYEVRFDDFVQSGAGKQFPAPALDGLYAIEFLFAGDTDFEFWVDDLAFLVEQ